MTLDIRHDWSEQEVFSLLSSPIEDLCERASRLHQKYGHRDVQQCKLLSVKTGGCAEDCGYCSQSAHFKTQLTSEPLLSVENVLAQAREAKEEGASRFCMGAAWRQVPKGEAFERLLQMIRGVADLKLEVCCTLGMADESQLQAMKEAGLTAYNHNLDTGRDYYKNIVTTRTYDERLETLRAVRQIGVQICSGGIIGLGESLKDRAQLLQELATINPHPESVPINLLVPIEGTPLYEKAKPVPFEEFLRMIAAARITMPRSRVRLSAGRNQLSEEEQLKCFAVGANSIFIGEKLLTAENTTEAFDKRLVERWASVQEAPAM